MVKRELYGTASCVQTSEMREWLEWRDCDFVEYDVEKDEAALEKMRALSGGHLVPVLVEDGQVVQVGWQGRGCMVGKSGGC